MLFYPFILSHFIHFMAIKSCSAGGAGSASWLGTSRGVLQKQEVIPGWSVQPKPCTCGCFQRCASHSRHLAEHVCCTLRRVPACTCPQHHVGSVQGPRACCQHRPHKPLPHHKLILELSSSLATTQHPCPCPSCPVWARWSWCGYCSPQQSPCPTAQHQQDPRPPPPSRLPSAGGNQVTFPIPASERTHLCLRGLFWIPGKL